MQLVPPMGAPCRGDHTGTFAVAGDLTSGEIPAVKPWSSLWSAGNGADRWDPMSVTVGFKMEFFFFINV